MTTLHHDVCYGSENATLYYQNLLPTRKSRNYKLEFDIQDSNKTKSRGFNWAVDTTEKYKSCVSCLWNFNWVVGIAHITAARSVFPKVAKLKWKDTKLHCPCNYYSLKYHKFDIQNIALPFTHAKANIQLKVHSRIESRLNWKVIPYFFSTFQLVNL